MCSLRNPLQKKINNNITNQLNDDIKIENATWRHLTIYIIQTTGTVKNINKFVLDAMMLVLPEYNLQLEAWCETY